MITAPSFSFLSIRAIHVKFTQFRSNPLLIFMALKIRQESLYILQLIFPTARWHDNPIKITARM